MRGVARGALALAAALCGASGTLEAAGDRASRFRAFRNGSSRGWWRSAGRTGHPSPKACSSATGPPSRSSRTRSAPAARRSPGRSPSWSVKDADATGALAARQQAPDVQGSGLNSRSRGAPSECLRHGQLTLGLAQARLCRVWPANPESPEPPAEGRCPVCRGRYPHVDPSDGGGDRPRRRSSGTFPCPPIRSARRSSLRGRSRRMPTVTARCRSPARSSRCATRWRSPWWRKVELGPRGFGRRSSCLGRTTTGIRMRCSAERLTPVVYDLGELELRVRGGPPRSPRRCSRQGRHRDESAGVSVDELDAVLARLRDLPTLRLAGLCTHFASADWPDEQ